MSSKFLFSVLFLLLFQLSSFAQNGPKTQALNNMNDLKVLIEDHTNQTLTQAQFMKYMETTEANKQMFEEISETMSDHPNYNADYFETLMTSFDRKLGSNSARLGKKKKKE